LSADLDRLTIRLRHKQQSAQASVQNDQMTYIVFGVDVTWEESVSPLSNNDNEGGGLRIFPGRSDPTDTTARNKVIVRAALDPPLSGFPVYFKVFDVDDPTPSSIDPDEVIDDNGLAGDDNFGSSVELSEDMVATDSNGRAEVDMEVAMNAGDNYRVAVSFDPDKLDGLTIEDDAAASYLPSGQAQLSGFAGKLSPMLTIWRKFWFEFDSMTTPTTSGSYEQTNVDSSIVVDISPLINDKTKIVLQDNLAGGINQYENRILIFPDGVTWFPLFGAFTEDTALSVNGIVPENLEGQTFVFGDDDWESPGVLKRPLPYDLRISTVLSENYKKCYVAPVETDQQYRDPNIPFDAYVDEPFDDYKDFGNDKDFWYVNFVAGWQTSVSNDDDPPETTLYYGQTFRGEDYGIIYVEPIRENENPVGSRDVEDYNVLHESGHALGLEHLNTEPRNIMDEFDAVGVTFLPHQIRHIRSHDEQTRE
jgi:hypothetical protein